MHKAKNGYVAGALLMLPQIRKMRDHIEFEKFQARVAIDNETTREFKAKTEAHKNKIYAFRYNSEGAEKLTAAGRGENGDRQSAGT